MSEETDLRIKALELACEGKRAEDSIPNTLRRAAAFYDFLANGTVIESPPEDASLDELYLSGRVKSALRWGDILTANGIREKTDAQLLALPNFGKRGLQELREAGLR